MSELAFCIDKPLSLSEGMLVISINEAEREGYFLKFGLKNPPLTIERVKKLISGEKEKEAIDFLLNEEMKFQKNKHGRAPHQINPSILHIPYAQSIQALKLISVTGKLCFNGKQLACDLYSAHPFFFKVETIENKKAQVRGIIKMKDQELDIRDCDFICGGFPNPWFIKGILLKMVSSEVDFKDLQLLYTGNALFSFDKISQLAKEAGQNPLSPQVIYAEDTKEKIEQLREPLPVLILKDKTGAFANLWMDYGSEERILYQERTIKTAFQRHLKAEENWEKDLLETDFIKKDMGNSHYYCPLDKVANSLGFLLELGWTIIDWRGSRVVHHGEVKVDLEKGVQEIKAKGKIKYEEFEVDLTQVAGVFNRREKFLEIAPGIVGLLPKTWENKGLDSLFDECEIVGNELRVAKTNLSTLSELFHSDLNLSLDDSLKTLKESLDSFQGIRQALPSKDFQGTLRPYQQEGVNWLNFLYEWNFNGILADDMGLGKTVQVLAFLSQILIEKPVLIVVPTSLIFNWRAEIEHFLPKMKFYIHHGSKRAKSAEFLQSQNFIITSYTTLRLDFSFFSAIDFQSVILDEAQNIKNAHTHTAQAIFKLNAKHRLSITGTPIENHPKELWSHFHFLMPELLGKESDFLDNIQAGVSDPRFFSKLKKKVRPFILRRKKEEVAKDLPERIDQIVWVEMEPAQRQLYESFLGSVKQNLVQKVKAEGISKYRVEIFETLLRLRQICCHPLLVSSLNEQVIDDSGKTEALLEDLETIIEEGRKGLVYSQFTSMLALLTKKAKEKGWNYVYLDGSTTDREKVVNQFQNDSSVSLFFISLKAGGIGLNLTAADYVFLYDPWWNDAIENQAINRAHRIGRKETVFAKRYIVIESIEEKILKLKNNKKDLIKDILDEEITHMQFNEEDFYFLLES